jgi:hypothetical protein
MEREREEKRKKRLRFFSSSLLSLFFSHTSVDGRAPFARSSGRPSHEQHGYTL